jgi:hypothetical protein
MNRCDICGATFETAEDLRLHQRVHKLKKIVMKKGMTVRTIRTPSDVESSRDIVIDVDAGEGCSNKNGSMDTPRPHTGSDMPSTSQRYDNISPAPVRIEFPSLSGDLTTAAPIPIPRPVPHTRITQILMMSDLTREELVFLSYGLLSPLTNEEIELAANTLNTVTNVAYQIALWTIMDLTGPTEQSEAVSDRMRRCLDMVCSLDTWRVLLRRICRR